MKNIHHLTSHSAIHSIDHHSKTPNQRYVRNHQIGLSQKIQCYHLYYWRISCLLPRLNRLDLQWWHRERFQLRSVATFKHYKEKLGFNSSLKILICAFIYQTPHSTCQQYQGKSKEARQWHQHFIFCVHSAFHINLLKCFASMYFP